MEHLPGLFPALSDHEAKEVTAIHTLAVDSAQQCLVEVEKGGGGDIE